MSTPAKDCRIGPPPGYMGWCNVSPSLTDVSRKFLDVASLGQSVLWLFCPWLNHPIPKFWHNDQGHNIQGTLCSRGATSKNFRSGTHRSGTHQPCIPWGAGTTILCRSWLYPPVRDLWIRLQTLWSQSLAVDLVFQITWNDQVHKTWTQKLTKVLYFVKCIYLRWTRLSILRPSSEGPEMKTSRSYKYRNTWKMSSSTTELKLIGREVYITVRLLLG